MVLITQTQTQVFGMAQICINNLTFNNNLTLTDNLTVTQEGVDDHSMDRVTGKAVGIGAGTMWRDQIMLL